VVVGFLPEFKTEGGGETITLERTEAKAEGKRFLYNSFLRRRNVHREVKVMEQMRRCLDRKKIHLNSKNSPLTVRIAAFRRVVDRPRASRASAATTCRRVSDRAEFLTKASPVFRRVPPSDGTLSVESLAETPGTVPLTKKKETEDILWYFW
jgi:hypothetical protein